MQGHARIAFDQTDAQGMSIKPLKDGKAAIGGGCLIDSAVGNIGRQQLLVCGIQVCTAFLKQPLRQQQQIPAIGR